MIRGGLQTLPFRLPANRRFYGRQAGAFPLVQPKKLWPGDRDVGNRLTKGHFRFAGQQIDLRDETWYPAAAGPDWLRRLHDFAWLDDLRASTDPRARLTARALVGLWIDDHGRYRAHSWHPATLATRLTQWMAHFDFLKSTADPGLQQAVLKSAAQQAAFLRRLGPRRLSGVELIRCLKALILVDLCLVGFGPTVQKHLNDLEDALADQVRADGSHAQRCPQGQMRVLLDLIDIGSALTLAAQALPQGIRITLASLAGAIRQLQHGNGRLARFQGEPLVGTDLIREALERADGGQTPAAGPEGNDGFYRLKARRSLLLVDAGKAPQRPGPCGVHAGTLAFEFSIGQVRLVTNCGNFDAGSDWAQFQRTTNAHSTLIWANRDSSELLSHGRVGRSPQQIQTQVEQDASGAYMRLSHDGYAGLGGGVHTRTLGLRADGLVLEGEDRMGGTGLDQALVRFHLNPGISAELTQTRRAALLRLSARETGWRFETWGARLQIAETVVASEQGAPTRSQQLILSPDPQGTAPDRGALRWRFSQEGVPL